MKIIVAGGRDFYNLDVIDKVLTENVKEEDSIISGDANGADMLGVSWAALNSVPVYHFPANWGKNGRAAGYIRNAEMAKVGDALIAFWNGKSKGTKHMIETMKKLGKPYKVFDYKGKEIDI